jgi:preprotein translocase subunit SecG
VKGTKYRDGDTGNDGRGHDRTGGRKGTSGMVQRFLAVLVLAVLMTAMGLSVLVVDRDNFH